MTLRAAAVTAATLGVALAALDPAEAAASPRTYLVLPFEDAAPEPARDWLREAMALSIGDCLLGAGQKVVGRDDRLLVMDEMDLPGGAPLTLATSIRVGRQLRSRAELPNPDRLIVGRFTLDQGRISASARVLDLVANRASPWREEGGSLKDLLGVERALARALLRDEGIPAPDLNVFSDDASAGHEFPLVAYEHYVRALTESDPARQQAQLRKAIQFSPGYPKATFRLALLLVRNGKAKEAQALLEKISGDPAPYAAEYHALLGQLAFEEKRLDTAEQEAQRSMSIRETVEGRLLMARLERARGNLEAAGKDLDRAAALDPYHPEVETLRRLLRKDAGPAR